MSHGEQYESPLYMTGEATPDVWLRLKRWRRSELVEFVFSVVVIGVAATLLAIFANGATLYFGAGLLAAAGAATVLDAIDRFRFWRHRARCTTCRERQVAQVGRRLPHLAVRARVIGFVIRDGRRRQALNRPGSAPE